MLSNIKTCFEKSNKVAIIGILSLNVLSFLFVGYWLYSDSVALSKQNGENGDCFITQCDIFVDTCKRNCHDSWCEPYQCTGTEIIIKLEGESMTDTLYRTFEIIQDAIDFCANYYDQRTVPCFRDGNSIKYGHQSISAYIFYLSLESILIGLVLVADLFLIRGVYLRSKLPTNVSDAYANL